MHSLLHGVAGLALLVPCALAQGVLPLVEHGDVFGGSTVEYVSAVDVNSDGQWVALVNLGSVGGVGTILKDGAVLLQEGDVAPGLFGAFVFDQIQAPVLGENGATVISAILEPFSGILTSLWVDDFLVAMADTPVGAPELVPGVPWHVVDSAVINAAGTVLARGTFGFSTPYSQLAAKLNPAAGYAANAVVWTGKVLPGQTHGVDSFLPNESFSDMNDAGEVLFTAHIGSLGGWALYKGDTLLAQEGQPSPVAGFNWSLFHRPDLNNAGSWVATAFVKNAALQTKSVLIKDGAVFAMQGDVLPASNPAPLLEIGGGFLADDGTLLWSASWIPGDSALLHEQTLLILENSTQIAGKTVSIIQDVARSDDGRFVAVAARFTDTTVGAYLFDLTGGSVTAIPTCSGNQGSLSAAGGPPKIGASFDLVLDAAQAPGALPFAGLSSQPAPGPGPCGLAIPGLGELLIDVAAPNPLITLAGAAWTGAPVAISLPVPALGSLVGKRFYAQGAFLDAGGTSAEPVRLTDGLLIDVGV